MLRWINQNLNKNTQLPPQQPLRKLQLDNPDLLPGTLGSRILDLEFLCDSEAITKQLIASLTCLYIEAIQYYQARNNDKYKIYTKRIEMFLKKTAVDEILRGKSGELVSKKEDAEKLMNQARTKSKSEVNRLLNNIEKKESHNKEVITKMLNDQNKRLEERIHKRKTMSNRSTYSDRSEEENEEGQNKYGGNMQRTSGNQVVLDGLGRARKVFI